MLAVALQRLSPYAHLRGSRFANGSLWLINLVVVGAVCGACACTVARWAAHDGIGLLNAMPSGPWLRGAITILGLDVVSYFWHRANHRVSLLWERRVNRVLVTPALHRRHHTKSGPDRDTNFATIFAAWDTVFGTRADSDSATSIETGLPGDRVPTLRDLLAMPVRGA
jgi:sterol desaturase/sphingolipid hydroxylase (fatty acid hydroxylase superfamily)